MWVDGTAEMVDALLAVQRRSAERLLDAQFRAARLVAESGLALATTGWRAVGSTAEAGPDRVVPG
jgi:hypothetical protein